MAANVVLAPPPAVKRSRFTRNQRRTLAFYTFISPWLIGFILLGIFPLVVGLLTSFTNYDGLNLATIKWVGMRNYMRATIDPDASFSAVRTLIWGMVNLPTWLFFSFTLALILNQNVRGRGFFRVAFYLPSVIPLVAGIKAWNIILDKNFGMLNALISLFRPGTAIGWMADYGLMGMTMIAVWGGLGVGMLIFLAGLQDIPDELIEAARIDGAGNLQIFRHITIPLMTRVIFFQLIMGLIGAFQQLNLPLILTQTSLGVTGTPPRPIYLYMIHTYLQIFTSYRYGYGTALLWLLFVVVIILTMVVFATERFWVYQDRPTTGGGAA